MGISHIFFPDVYRAYYKAKRQDLLSRSREKQILDQEQILNTLIFNLSNTSYGKEKNINFLIENDYEVLKMLPQVVYEELYPYIHRMWEGERSVLWPGKIKYFSKSSGTTNAKSKFIPISKESIEENHFMGGRDMLGMYLLLNTNSKLGFESVLPISGSLQDINEKAGTYAGDISWVLDQNVPWWTNLMKALPPEILEIKAWDKRLPEVINYTKNMNLKVFTGTITWIHIFLTESIKKYEVSDAVQLWPEVEVFFHGAVSIKPYKKEFEKLIPKKDFYYIDNYNASEGFFAFQDSLESDGGMLLLCGHGIFYEFINIKNNQEILTVKDLELGSKYEMMISTFSGLWRYRLGDVVEIVNLDPVRIKIAGRTQAVLNAYGEELMVGNVDEAIRILNDEYGYEILEYTGAPIYKNDAVAGGHEWVIEFKNIPEDKNKYITQFDQELKKLNADYEAKRNADIVLCLPKIHFVKEGTFYQWMESRGKTGGQNKIPRLSEDRAQLQSLIQ